MDQRRQRDYAHCHSQREENEGQMALAGFMEKFKIKLNYILNFLFSHQLLYDPFMSELLLKFNWNIFNITFLLPAM